MNLTSLHFQSVFSVWEIIMRKMFYVLVCFCLCFFIFFWVSRKQLHYGKLGKKGFLCIELCKYQSICCVTPLTATLELGLHNCIKCVIYGFKLHLKIHLLRKCSFSSSIHLIQYSVNIKRLWYLGILPGTVNTAKTKAYCVLECWI